MTEVRITPDAHADIASIASLQRGSGLLIKKGMLPEPSGRSVDRTQDGVTKGLGRHRLHEVGGRFRR